MICGICGYEIENPDSATAIWEFIIHGYCYSHISEVGFQMTMFNLENYEER